MATWQYDIHLIPKQKLVELYKDVPSILEREAFDAINWWENVQLPFNYEFLITSFLPPAKSWDAQIKLWGEKDSDRLEIILDDGEVIDVYIRLDVRILSSHLIKNIVGLAKQCESLILTPEMKLIEPDIGILLSTIKKSKASQFIKSPRRFLKRAGGKHS